MVVYISYSIELHVDVVYILFKLYVVVYVLLFTNHSNLVAAQPKAINHDYHGYHD